ncbi:MAG: type IX secretion system plug protein domain-containing protein, partial [Bacteroidota bacterium]
MMRFLLCLFVAIGLMGCPASTEEASRQASSPKPQDRKVLIPEDYRYETNIKTAQLYRGNTEESYPVIYLGTTGFLTLEFDELMPLDQRESDFFVDIVNCDVNWEPTNVLPVEFYEGFTQDRIDLFDRSEFTKIPYVHYWYQFPQEKESFKMSGNYLLKVYRNGDPNDLVLTRRFIVVDPRIPVQTKYLLNDRVERLSFGNFSFEVATASLNVVNPTRDLQIQILQNFRWDNRIQMGLPRFQADNTLEYFVNVGQDFPGGNEFRRHLVSSTRFYSESMQSVEERENIYDIYLFPDESRSVLTTGGRRDRNGSFGVRVNEWPNPDQQADYVRNHFSLKQNQPVKGEVYVQGRFSDWQLLPEYRLTYNAPNQRYEGSVILKQGIYDYQYVVKDPVD